MGQNINEYTLLRNLTGKILMDTIRPPVLAILLETIERENLDSAKSVNIFHQKLCYMNNSKY